MDEIKPKKIKTKSIKKGLENFSVENNISIGKCYFTLNEIATYIKTRSDSSFRLFNEDVNLVYRDKDKLANEHVEFKQVYIITIREETKCKIKLNYSIDFEESLSSPKIVIYPDSHIPYDRYKAQELFMLLVKEINKIKALNRILVNIFDYTMINNLKKFTKYIYAGKFRKKIKIPLFDGLEPEISRPSKLIMWFQEKKVHQQINEVEIDEVLVEFKKPIYGKNGLNSFGEQVSGYIGTNKEAFQGTVDYKSIEVMEDDKKIKYISKLKGFVTFNNNHLKVDNKIKMSRLSRVQEVVSEDEDNNVEVIVAQNDTSEDSVGEGVKLTSETIHVTGFVGSKSVLEASNLQIDGATHKDSKQFAKFANINRHKGTLKCHDAKIALLEGGEVHATKVHVQASIGGVIYAQDVIIDQVKSNLKIYASNSITIRHVIGEDNLFKINYKDIPVLKNKINFILKDIDDLSYTLEEAERHDRSQIPIIKEKIQKLKNIQNEIVSSSMRAKISIEKPFRGLNVINFTLENGNELIFKTDAKSYTPFYIEQEADKITLYPVLKTLSLNS